MKIYRLAASAVAVSLTLCASIASATTYAGPDYPPPGGVTFSHLSGSATTGTSIVEYSNFDLTKTGSLYFALAAAEGLSPDTPLTYDAGLSNLAGGIAVLDTTAFGQERFTEMFTDTSGHALSLTLSSSIGLDASGLGVAGSPANTPVLLVTGDYKVAESYTADFGFGRSSSIGAFNQYKTNDHVGSEVNIFTNTSGGFYSTAPGVPEPASWALMLVGFGGLGAILRRRRRVALAT